MKPTADNPPEATPYAPGAPFTSEKTTRIFIPAILMHFGAAAGGGTHIHGAATAFS
jgi:hypothetical protein